MSSSTSTSSPLEIGLLGCGNIGSALARHFRRLGHRVLISNSRGPETLAALADEIGAQAVTAAEAAKARDVVVVSVPQLFTPKLRLLFADVPPSVIVIDTNNYYPSVRDGVIDEVEASQVDSEWVAKQIGRPVVKVFNSIGAASLLSGGKPAGTPGRIALAVSGDPVEHRQRVMQLVEDIGFDAVDNGDLANSWRQQPGTPGYCLDWDREKLREGMASAEKGKLAEYRKAAEDWAMRVLPDQVAQQREAVRKHA